MSHMRACHVLRPSDNAPLVQRAGRDKHFLSLSNCVGVSREFVAAFCHGACLLYACQTFVRPHHPVKLFGVFEAIFALLQSAKLRRKQEGRTTIRVVHTEEVTPSDINAGCKRTCVHLPRNPRTDREEFFRLHRSTESFCFRSLLGYLGKIFR